MTTNKINYDRRIPARAVVLFYEIKRLSEDNGYCSVTNEWFSKRYGISNSTIKRCLSCLEKCGYIKRHIRYTKNIKKVRKIFVLENQ